MKNDLFYFLKAKISHQKIKYRKSSDQQNGMRKYADAVFYRSCCIANDFCTVCKRILHDR